MYRSSSLLSRLRAPHLVDVKRDVDDLADPSNQIIVALDAYDVIRHCFPISPMSPSELNENPEVLAERLTAVEWILKHDSYRCLLLPEYLGEILAFVEGVQSSYRDIALVDEQLRSRLRAFSSGVPRVGVATEMGPDFVEEHFTRWLALQSGALEVGFKRLLLLLEDQVSPLSGVIKVGSKENVEEFEALCETFEALYSPNKARVQTLTKQLKTVSDNVPSENQRRVTRSYANAVDARAIDRIWYYNQAFREAAAQKDSYGLGASYRIVLVSSSTRLRQVFAEYYESDAERRVLRSPDQLFAFLVESAGESVRKKEGVEKHEARSGPLQLISQGMNALAKLRDAETNAISNQCETCVLKGGLGLECENKNYCDQVAAFERVATRFYRVQDRIENLAVFFSLSKALREFRANRPEAPESMAKLLVAQELTDESLRLSAVDRFHQYSQDAILLAEFTNQLVLTRQSSIIGFLPAYANSASLGARVALLPWPLRTQSATANDIFGKTMSALVLGVADSRRRKMLGTPLRQLLLSGSLSAGSIYRPEYDELRVFYCLIFGSPRLLEIAGKLVQQLIQNEPEHRSEAEYLSAWVLFHAHNLDDSTALASRLVEDSRHHNLRARLFHILALGHQARFSFTLSSSMQRPAESTERNHRTLARKYFVTAADLFTTEEYGSPARTLLAQGFCLHGACVESLILHELPAARRYLDRLKITLTRESWTDSLAFLHFTEALVEWCEAENEQVPELRLRKLRHSLDACERAGRGSTSGEVVELTRAVTAALTFALSKDS